MTTSGVEVWRGGVKSEQIDEMGHLNIRFYVAIASEGLIGFAQALGLSEAFRPGANATLIIREHHIRFLREARVRAPLHMTASIVELGETTARVLFVLWHSLTGEPAATFNTVVEHVTAKQGRAFPWTSAARARAGDLMGDLAPFAAPKSVPVGAVQSQASVARADALAMTPIARGAFKGSDCDVFGRMNADLFMGHIVSGIPQMGGGFRETVIEHTDPKPSRVGNAALEYRLIYLDWPRAGDLYVMRSGSLAIDAKGMNVIHWMLDPVTGKPWGSCQAYIVTFDLDKRKIMPVPPAAKVVLDQRLAVGVSL